MKKTNSIAAFNEDGKAVTLTHQQYNYDQQISALTAEERTKYLAMTEKMDKHDISSITSYGKELSSVISKNGDSLLNSVRGDNNSEVVKLTNDLLAQLELIDIDELSTYNRWKKFIRNIPIIGRCVKSITAVLHKYDTIQSSVANIGNKIEEAKIVALRDNSTLNTIFEANVTYIDQIRELILAAKIREKEVQNELSEMNAHAEKYEVYEINDTNNFLNQLQKKIADMQTTEYVLTQNLFQIRATQHNNISIANKSDNIVNNVLPLWKNQLSLSIIMYNQKNSIDAQKRITDTTNKILKENAKTLKMNSINVAQAAEESVIKIDTLRETTKDLIDTINEVKRIHDEGTKSRAEYETHLKEFAKQLETSICA